jgi:hypothetical protein
MHRAFILATVAAFITSVATAQEQSSDERSRESDSHSRSLHDSRIVTGYRITPVQLNLRGKNRFLVGLGSYIVNAQGACNDCHTNPPYAPGGDPFQGEPEKINAERFLAGGRPFGPGLVSANITPDENGRPAGLTFEQFETLLRTGRDPENPDRILQVMPWNIYGKMTTLDLRAIYEYLRAIPSLPSAPPP